MAITAVTEESGVIMGVRHRTYTLEAVQYHPESVLSESGDDLLKNFLSLKGGSWEDNPSVRVHDLALPPFPIDTPNGVATPGANKLPTILEKIHVQRLKDIDVAKNTPGTTPADIDTLLSMNLSPPLIPLVSRMRTTPETAPALMAEIKRASPSKGPISMSANAAQQALTYALSGASVISVLTEPTWFKGSLLDMRLARQAIDALPNRPAILRKDFIVDEYQIAEARLHGADTVLLIVAMLPIHRLKALYGYSLSLGMEPLVEVNNAAEMGHAISLGAKVVGVNNRNLHNFEVDMGTTSRLADMVKEKDIILCALSGISSHEDVKLYVEQGVNAVLVGESLMRAKDTSAFIRDLLGWPETQGAADEDSSAPLVKICGIRSLQEAQVAVEVGADLLGLMFVPTSKRHVPIDEAIRISHAVRSLRLENITDESLLHLSKLSVSSSSNENIKNAPWFTHHSQRLSSSLPPHHARPLLVGVFQNQPLEFILEIASTVQLDIVQLHGNEPLHWANHIPVPVIRVFHVGSSGGTTVEGITRPGLHQFVLLDSARNEGGLSGGTGKLVDWDLAKEIVDAGEVPSPKPEPQQQTSKTINGSFKHQTTHRMPLILAGGLTPDNVAEAIRAVRPWAVDVSGGVEKRDGSGKDPEKVAAFVRAVKGWPVPVLTSEAGVEVGDGLSVDLDSPPVPSTKATTLATADPEDTFPGGLEEERH